MFFKHPLASNIVIDGDPMNVVFWLLLIQLFVWLGLIGGLWLVLEVILQITLPVTGWLGTFLTGAVRIGTSAGLAVLWLWLWKKIEYAYFWRTIKKSRRN